MTSLEKRLLACEERLQQLVVIYACDFRSKFLLIQLEKFQLDLFFSRCGTDQSVVFIKGKWFRVGGGAQMLKKPDQPSDSFRAPAPLGGVARLTASAGETTV